MFFVQVGDFDKGNKGRGRFQDAHWFAAVTDKLQFTRALMNMKSGETGEYMVREEHDSLLFSDLDIIPLGFYSRISQSHEMMFMGENFSEDPENAPEVNTGFFLWKNTPRTRRFVALWNDRMDMQDGSSGNQPIANKILSKPEPHGGPWNYAVWDKKLKQDHGERCAAVFEVPNSRGSFCAAVHALQAGFDSAKKKIGGPHGAKLTLLNNAWGHAIGNSSVEVDDFRCAKISFADVNGSVGI